MKSSHTINLSNRYIEITPDIAGGRPRIAGRRITVQNISFWHEWMGQSVDEIAVEYNLTLADVYAALSYYFEHRVEIDRAIDEDRTLAEAMRKSMPLKLKKKLKEIKVKKDETKD